MDAGEETPVWPPPTLTLIWMILIRVRPGKVSSAKFLFFVAGGTDYNPGKDTISIITGAKYHKKQLAYKVGAQHEGY